MESTESGGNVSRVSPKSWCHPAHMVHRFMALILMCFLCFGSYFCYDAPGALADNFKSDLHLTTSQFSLLYSIYSWPNTILCFIGGFLIDRYFGVRLGTLLYLTVVLVGALVFAFGVYINAFWLMIMGRFIFGIGGESLQVAVNSYVVLWFKAKEMNMVFGLQLSFSRFGSTVNFWVMKPIYLWVANYYGSYEKLGVALFIASLTCVISLFCGLIMGWMDYRAERILGRESGQENEQHFHLQDVLIFKPVFWLVAVIIMAYYVAIFPFISLGILFFERKFDLLPQEANTLNSLIYVLSAVLSPFLGIIIDKTGRNVIWIIMSVVTTISAHFLLAFTFYNPYIGVILLGISFSSLASSLWPLVAFTVVENQLGTAFGICQAALNLGLATVLILAGIIVDEYGYFILEVFFLGCLFVSLIAAILIYIMDSANNGVLNMSRSMREKNKVKSTADEVISLKNKTSEELANLLDNKDKTEAISLRNKTSEELANLLDNKDETETISLRNETSDEVANLLDSKYKTEAISLKNKTADEVANLLDNKDGTEAISLRNKTSDKVAN